MSSLQRFIAVLVKHRRFIFWEVALVTVAAMVYSLVAKPAFTTEAQIMPPANEETTLLGASSILNSISAGAGMRLGSSLHSSSSSDLVAAILKSRTVRDRVVDSCDYMTAGRFKSREAALKQLATSTKVNVSDEDIISLAVTAGSPAYAVRLANSYITETDRFLRESNMTRGKNMRIFVGQRLAETESELAYASDSLAAFQKRNHITDIDEESKAAIEAYAKLQAEKIAQDVELSFAQDLAGTANPYVQMLRDRSSDFDRQLRTFEQGGGTKRFGIGMGVPLDQVPDLSAEYARRLSDYKVKQELRALLIQQYEQARITEVHDTPTITLLDPPRPPERRSSPKRTITTLMAFALSLTVAIVISYLFEFWNDQHQDENRRQEWQRILQPLIRQKRKS